MTMCVKHFGLQKALLLGFVFAMAGCGPSTYEDCILENMKGEKTSAQAQMVMVACAQKFSSNKKHAASNALNSNQLNKVEVRVRNDDNPFSRFAIEFPIRVYNGNENVTVTQVTLLIRQKNDGKISEMKYNVDINVPPLSTNETKVKILEHSGKGETYTFEEAKQRWWDLVGAKGY